MTAHRPAHRRLVEILRKKGGLRIWIFAVVAVTAIFSFLVIFDEVQEAKRGEGERIHLLDRSILEEVAAHRTDALNQVMTDITALGSVSVTALLTILFLFGLWRLKQYTAVAHLLVLQTGTLILPRFLKYLIDRPRPSFVPHLARTIDSSFPSGHSFNAAAFYLGLAFFLGLRFRGLKNEACFVGFAFLIILLVASSRIYLGVHYPTDVFAGICAGSAWSLIVAIYFIPKYRRKSLGAF